MPRLSFARHNFKDIEIPMGTPLMKGIVAHKIPVASSCGGDGICSKCAIRIVEGAENLSVETTREVELRERNGISIGHRISCQTYVYGDIVVDTTYW